MTNPRETHTVPDTGEGRAQPGDVIAPERDGERTHLGDTREDEDKRREDAEQDVRDKRRS
jgi:hypothetical protein